MYRFTDNEYAQLYFAFGRSFLYTLSKGSSGSSQNTDTTFSKSSSELTSTQLGIGPSFSFIIKSHLYGSISLISEYNLSADYTWNIEMNNSPYARNENYS